MRKTWFGTCIYQSDTGAKVHQNFFYRWLTLGGEELHSMINRRNPHLILLNYIHQLIFAVQEHPSEYCLLGLGGAGVIHALEGHSHQIKSVAVENNADIITIANSYFYTKSIKNLHIIQQDAAHYVQTCHRKFGHVLVDLFGKESFPAQCNTQEFFNHCKQLLLPNGFLAVNITDLKEESSILKHIRHTFSNKIVLLPVKRARNVIALCCNTDSLGYLIDMLTSSSHVKALSWDTNLGCIAHLHQ